jgi:hypothetical protein
MPTCMCSGTQLEGGEPSSAALARNREEGGFPGLASARHGSWSDPLILRYTLLVSRPHTRLVPASRGLSSFRPPGARGWEHANRSSAAGSWNTKATIILVLCYLVKLICVAACGHTCAIVASPSRSIRKHAGRSGARLAFHVLMPVPRGHRGGGCCAAGTGKAAVPERGCAARPWADAVSALQLLRVARVAALP